MERASFHPVGRLRRSAAGLGMFIASLLLCAPPAPASAVVGGQARPAESDVKAAYLLNFGKFIRVSPPGAARSHFDICLIGSDPMGKELESLAADEQIDSRPVRVRRVTDPADARSCDIAYLSTMDGARLDSELGALRNSDVLTVGEGPTFLEHGGMIQFVLVAQHVRFSVNLTAVRSTHLVLSSELLRVAYSITGKTPGEGQP